MNKVMLIGRLGGDPELKTAGSSQVAKFSLATTKKWKQDGEAKERTDWHNCSAWGKLAELCSKYLRKGQQVYVEGELNHNKSEKDGETKYFTTVKVESIEFLGSKDKSDSSNSSKTSEEEPDPSDLPF